MAIKYFSTFSGIAGFEVGMNKAYGKQLHNHQYESAHLEIESGRYGNFNEQGNGVLSANDSALCVGYCEIDRHASAIYRYHYPDHRAYGDITKLTAESIPDFDFFVGGFPCQAFSIAGKRAGFDDVRGTLFFEIARILAHKRPRHFLLENVKGLLSHDGGKTYQRILEVLADIGYFVETIVLNSKDYGVPQNRERIFFVGHLGDECEREILSFSEGDDWNLEALSERGVIRGRNKSLTGCLDTRGVNAFDRADLDKILFFEPKIRRLTPTECESLQGFEKDWTKYGLFENGKVIEISDSQRYKVCGNAVTTNVIQAIVSEMIGKGCL